MDRRTFLGSVVAPMMAQGPAKKPNIVFILADDLGYGDLGCYGQKQVKTPAIDRLASEGIRFTSVYAGSTVCAPSRCCLHTGYHTGHAWVRGNLGIPNELALRPGDVTIAEMLKKAGYRTGIFGKWALGVLGTTGYPLDKGFDEWFGFFSQTHAHNYYPEHLLDGRGALQLKGNMGTQKKDYAPDLILDRAVKFIEKTSEPFFLYFPSTLPHANNEMGRDTGDGMEIPENAPYGDRAWPKVEKNFAAMVTRLDRDVARLMETLERTGKDRDTIVIFTSDNGPHKEGGHDAEYFDSNGPVRGTKRDLYEGGIRVPGIVRWKGKVQPGQVSEEPWAFWDVMPTLAEIAGVAAPKGIDGISMLPTFLGRPGQKRHEYFYWEFHERGFAQAVRMGKWKAVRKTGVQTVELYDLSNDVGEERDVAAANPEVARRMQEIMRTARTESQEFPVKA
mgnify:CR=1 FL=1